ncbi:MAG TPA: 50S ribosomal protein L11 methyltransferase [Sphingomicrobium sp.]|nr:50S ribosomal protein L11 methyltransferase [Sphingomicrobium sp.]
MSWRATVPCSRAQGETIAHAEDLFPVSEYPPVLVVDEPDPSSPNSWLIHAYFDERPTSVEIATLTSLGNGPPQIEQLGEEDWVRMSQSGLQPIRAGRFFVHTPTSPPDPAKISFEIDAGLAFGTGQHATTAGCLEVLDKLERQGANFTTIADVGTGTGLLAFASLALWPGAKCIASDIDPIAIDVARENAAINGVKQGHGRGELLLAQADGMSSALLSARAPFDLIIANILAAPLIDLAGDFAKALSPGGMVVLAGLLDTQATKVRTVYENHGLELADETDGEWPVLVLRAPRSR